MNKEYILEQTKKMVYDKLSNEGSGHDWWHIYRVHKMAMNIAQKEDNADLFVVELAALLHDIADWKFNDGDLNAGARVSQEFLSGLGVDKNTIDHVSEIVRDISFKGAGEKNAIKTLEGMIVQDADRLDAIGAIGIARAFAYGGNKNREMYDPDIKPEHHNTFEEYKNSKGTTVNHFYEKLLLLKDRMNTKAGREIALKRHRYMEEFLQNFYDEWDGIK